MRYKLVYIALVTAVLYWAPSIGTSGVTGAVTPGSEVYRAAFGWHSDDKNEAKLLAELNAAAFQLATNDSQKLFDK